MSATTNALRASLRRPAPGNRHASSSAASSSKKKDVRPRTILPPKKMRALVSLYHQSGSFITPQNLDAKIDAAFFDHKATTISSPEQSLDFVVADLHARQNQPKLGDASLSTTGPRTKEEPEWRWSDLRDHREVQVMRALFGTEIQGKPGLAALEEEGPRIQMFKKRDEQKQS